MEEYIHYVNLTLFMRHLADPNITDERRRMLTRLLALEEAINVRERTDLRNEFKSVLPSNSAETT